MKKGPLGKHTRINPVKIVEVWGKAETLDGAVDVRLDVLRRIGDAAAAKNIKTTLGGD